MSDLATGDAIRLFLMSQTGLTVGGMLVIAWVYFRLWRAAQTALLPSHILCMSAAHGLLLFYAMLDITDHVGTPVSWRTLILFSALVVSDLALALLLTYERKRIRRIRHGPLRRIDDI